MPLFQFYISNLVLFSIFLILYKKTQAKTITNYQNLSLCFQIFAKLYKILQLLLFLNLFLNGSNLIWEPNLELLTETSPARHWAICKYHPWHLTALNPPSDRVSPNSPTWVQDRSRRDFTTQLEHQSVTHPVYSAGANEFQHRGS